MERCPGINIAGENPWMLEANGWVRIVEEGERKSRRMELLVRVGKGRLSGSSSPWRHGAEQGSDCRKLVGMGVKAKLQQRSDVQKPWGSSSRSWTHVHWVWGGGLEPGATAETALGSFPREVYPYMYAFYCPCVLADLLDKLINSKIGFKFNIITQSWLTLQ